MTTVKLSEKQIFVLKATLVPKATLHAGDCLALRIDIGLDRTFRSDLNYWFFPLLRFVVMQWTLLSEHLQKGWVISRIIGYATLIPINENLEWFVMGIS